MSDSFHKKKLQLFYIVPLLYIISIYMSVILIGTEDPAEYLLFLPAVFGVLNIIVSVRFCKLENRMMLLNAAILCKYATIPFFLVGGLVLTLCFLLSFIPVPFMIFVGPALALVGVVIGWLVLAFESPYLIAYWYLSVKEGKCSKVSAVFGIIFQFFFLIDVIEVMYLTFKEKKKRWLTATVLGALVLAFLTAVILLIYAGSTWLSESNSGNEDIKIRSLEVYSAAENDAQIYHANYPYYFYAFTADGEKYKKSGLFNLNEPVRNASLSQDDIRYFIEYISALSEDGSQEGNNISYYVRLHYTDESGEDVYLYDRGYDTFPNGWEEFIDHYNQILGGEYLAGSGEVVAITPEFLTETFGVSDEDVRSGTLQDVIDTMELDLLECTGLFYIDEMLDGYYVKVNEEAMEPYRPKELISKESTLEEYDAFVEKYLEVLGWDPSMEMDSGQDGFRYFYNKDIAFYIARTADMDMLPIVEGNNGSYYTMELDAHMEGMTMCMDFYYNGDYKYLIIPSAVDPDMILAFGRLN